MSAILADTGALLALLDRRERFHDWAVEQAKNMPAPLLTCEPSLAELCYLLSNLNGGTAAVAESLATGAWKLNFSLQAEKTRVFALMETYAELPMSLEDACLVRMAEQQAGAKVFTLDGHFKVYRKNRRQVIPLIIPPQV